MNKKNVDKIKSRIAQLEKEMDSNRAKIRTIQILNKSLEGGIIELSSMLIDLAPEEKVKKT